MHPAPTFTLISLSAPERCLGIEHGVVISPLCIRTVVTGEKYQRMIGDVQFIQFTDQLAYLVIQECDHRRIGRLRHNAVHIMPLRSALLCKEYLSHFFQLDLSELIV